MSIGVEVEALRYFLRDPDSKIWSNSILFGLYNQAQSELQIQTNIMEGITTIELPPEFQASYTYDWEAGLAQGSTEYQCLRTQGNNFTFCYPWEVQQNYGVATPDAADLGTYAYTHPWEAFLKTPNKPPPIPFPDDMFSVKQMFHDEMPLMPITSKDMMQSDPSWNIREGTPLAYYVDSEVENQFLMYGRPTTITWTNQAGEGMVTSVEDDTTGSEFGIQIISTGRSLVDDDGITINIIDTDNNMLLLYDIAPPDVEGLSDDSYVPDYLKKYIRYRVLQLAYMANTDGKNEEMATFWGERNNIGKEVVKRFRGNRYKDIDRRLRTQEGTGARRTKHPKLPDTYPATYP